MRTCEVIYLIRVLASTKASRIKTFRGIRQFDDTWSFLTWLSDACSLGPVTVDFIDFD